VNSTATEEVLWHATLSHEAEAAVAAVRAHAAGGGGSGKRDPADIPAALQLHMLNPDMLMSGMVTQVGGARSKGASCPSHRTPSFLPASGFAGAAAALTGTCAAAGRLPGRPALTKACQAPHPAPPRTEPNRTAAPRPRPPLSRGSTRCFQSEYLRAAGGERRGGGRQAVAWRGAARRSAAHIGIRDRRGGRNETRSGPRLRSRRRRNEHGRG
jgi:hypothetical protein